MKAHFCRSFFSSIGVAVLLLSAGESVLAQPQKPADPDFELGMQKLKQKAYDDAYDAFRRSHRADPRSARSVVAMAETLMAQDRAEEAIGLFQVEVRKNPANADLGVGFGDVLMRIGRVDQALFEFNKALKTVDPGSRTAGEIHLRMGEAYRRKGDNASAMASLKRARDLMPDSAEAVMTMALIYERSGQKDRAIQMYREVLKIEPGNGMALNNLAYAMLETGGDVDEALKLALQATQVLPDSLDAKDTLAFGYLKKQDVNRAIDTLRPLLTAETGNPNYRNHFAMALDQKGDTSPAAQELKTLLRAKASPENEARIRQLLQGPGH
jgi:Tfp pilus assembly protein PilF